MPHKETDIIVLTFNEKERSKGATKNKSRYTKSQWLLERGKSDSRCSLLTVLVLRERETRETAQFECAIRIAAKYANKGRCGGGSDRKEGWRVKDRSPFVARAESLFSAVIENPPPRPTGRRSEPRAGIYLLCHRVERDGGAARPSRPILCAFYRAARLMFIKPIREHCDRHPSKSPSGLLLSLIV